MSSSQTPDKLKKAANTSTRKRFSQSLDYLMNKAVIDILIDDLISKEIATHEENRKIEKTKYNITKNNEQSLLKEEQTNKYLENASPRKRSSEVLKAKNKTISSSRKEETQNKLKKAINNDYDEPFQGIFEKNSMRDTVDNRTQKQNIPNELSSKNNKRKNLCGDDILEDSDNELKKFKSNDKQEKSIQIKKIKNLWEDEDLMLKEIDESHKVLEESVAKKKANCNPPKNKMSNDLICEERKMISLSLPNEDQINDRMQEPRYNNTGRKGKRSKALVENNENQPSPQKNEITDNNPVESSEQSTSTIYNIHHDRIPDKSGVNHYKAKVIGTSLKIKCEDSISEPKKSCVMKFDENSHTRNKKKKPGEWPPLKSKYSSVVPDSGGEETESYELNPDYMKLAKAFSDDAISEDIREKLRQLEIILPWEVPPLHLKFPFIGRNPSMAEQKEIENQGIRINRGVYKKYEDDIIRKNFQNFCQLHDLDVDPVPFLHLKGGRKQVFNKSQRAKFGQFIAHGLDERILYSVYTRFRRLYWQSFGKAGRFTEKEDNFIISYINNSSSVTPICDLSRILKRDYKSVSNRYSVLSEERQTVSWSVDMIQKFVNELLEISSVEDIYEFKKREITRDEYKQLSERLNIPVEKLRRAWYGTIFPKLFSSRTLTQSTLKEIKSSLITKLYEAKVRDCRSVDFESLAQDYDGIPPLKLYTLLKTMVQTHVPRDLHSNFRKCIVYLKKNLETLRGLKAKSIPTYRFSNGQILSREDETSD